MMRGIADGAGRIDAGTNYYGKWHRVFLHIDNSNWHLPIQVCKILQEHLEVPVQGILWGHPNMRDPRLKDYKREKKGVSFREHQIRILDTAFQQVGFWLDYKRRALTEWCKFDEKRFGNHRVSFCNPMLKVYRKNQVKPIHPEENSEKLPDELTRKHFNAYWEICLALGCEQGKDRKCT